MPRTNKRQSPEDSPRLIEPKWTFWLSEWTWIFVGVLVILATWGLASRSDPEKIEFELYKFLFNVGFVTLGVGGLKFLLEEQRALETFRAETTKTLGEVHAKLYILRGTLRLGSNSMSRIDECIVELMTARAMLGNIGHQMRTRRKMNGKDVIRHTEAIRHYLEDLINESIEKHRGLENGETFEAGELLKGFVGLKKSNDYKCRFKAPYLRAKNAADPSWEMGAARRRVALMAEYADDYFAAEMESRPNSERAS